MLAGLAFMAVHAKPEPERVASSLSKSFHIDLRKAEMCVHKTGVTMDDLRALEDVVTNHDKAPVDQKSIRRASCTLTCCAQTQGTMTGNKIELEAIQMLIQKSNIPEDGKATANGALIACTDEVKSIIDECDVSFAFFRCLALQSEKFGN